MWEILIEKVISTTGNANKSKKPGFGRKNHLRM
jgi:hypothetical protein